MYNRVHYFITENIRSLELSGNLENILIGVVDFILLMFLAILLDYILKNIFLIIAQHVVDKTKFHWDNILLENRVFNSISHFISISVIIFFIPHLIPKRYHHLIELIENVFHIIFILIFIQFITRIINSIVVISTHENNHRTIAVRSFAQLSKIFTYISGTILLISILLKQDITVIIGSLSAFTAVIILVFKDTFLGFVSGVQIASTRMIKVGDWITIPKHDIDGIVLEVNLVSAKIQNFDKTISSIPTYDLISSSVKNYEPISKANIRRIKRSLIFNTKSFFFLEISDLEKFNHFQLIKSYLQEKSALLLEENKKHAITNDSIINGRQLTNIGVFRKYTELYLKNHPQIDQNQTLIVRQLDPTPHGLPLEIYCFTTSSDWATYENIQADIFDHLLTSTREFKLDLVQVLSK
ncbi:MAG: mechanosensitive ion channel family protein [Flavobacteriales bacterium]